MSTSPSALAAWRAKLRRWSKPPRRLTFTRAGKFFMAITLVMGAGALNTGNNLLFLILGMMISAIIASGIASEAVLRRLQLERHPPERLWADTPSIGHFVVHNPRGYPSYNIEAIERRATCTEGPFAGGRAGGRDVPWWKFWVPDLFGDDHYLAIARLAYVGADDHARTTATYTFGARGIYRSWGMRLATRFPFGLFHKVSDLEDPRDFVVFPTPRAAPQWQAQLAARFGDAQSAQAGPGQEYFGLRAWRPGEDKRAISWKRSAKREGFVVRETERQERRALMFTLINRAPAPQPTPSHHARFEQALGELTWLLETLSGQGHQLGLRTLDVHLGLGQGPGHLDRMLGCLAVTSLYGQDQAPAQPAGYVGQEAAQVALSFGPPGLGRPASLGAWGVSEGGRLQARHEMLLYGGALLASAAVAWELGAGMSLVVGAGFFAAALSSRYGWGLRVPAGIWKHANFGGVGRHDRAGGELTRERVT